jgi:protein-tyrosine-phosphatase
MERSVKPRRWTAHTPGFDENAQVANGSDADGRRSVSEEFRKPVTPFGGWVRDERSGRLRPLETGPHIGGFAPPDTGITRKWLSQSAVLWPGPALVSSSKDDLMQLVASRRYGRAALLDLRPIDAPYYPAEFTRYRFDPTQLISTLEDAQAVAETLLSMSAVALAGGSFRTAADPGQWDQLAFAPLTCLLFAASPVCTGSGMEWTLEAAEDVEKPRSGLGYQVNRIPSWASAAALCGSRLFEARVRGVLDMEPRQRDSVKITVTKVLTAWLRTSLRDRELPSLDLSLLDEHHATVYLLTPDDGTMAPQAITLMDQLINRQRVKTAQCEEFPRVGMFLDEITNTPLPRLPRYLAESHSLGVSICFAAQSGSQLDAVYGPLQGSAIREVVPASLIMYGAHEEDLPRAASFWAGKTTPSHQSNNHNGNGKTAHRVFSNALEPEELIPRDENQARLIVRGTAGRMVHLLEWPEFVAYLDELRGGRQRHALELAAARLHSEFADTFDARTIERFLYTSYDQLAVRATVQEFLALLAERFARQRIRALAKVEGKSTEGKPVVLFLCNHNAGRSQMAMGFFTHLTGGAAVAWSGGSEPKGEINPAAITAMAERGIDLASEYPKPWTDEILQAADVVITMGCGDAPPTLPGRRYEDWALDDPNGKEVAAVRPIRDEIERRVRRLLAELAIPYQASPHKAEQ